MKRFVLIAVALVTLASCGTSSITTIPRAQLPADLYGSTVHNTSPNATTVRVYLVEGTRLAAVDRNVRSTLPAPNLVMSELLKGPTQAELQRGLTTDIPNTVRLLDVSVLNGIASVNLSHDFELATPDRPTFLLRLAEVVFSLTELDNVDSVRFLVEGQPVSVLVQDSSLVAEPVARGRYSDFAPRSSGAAVSENPIG